METQTHAFPSDPAGYQPQQGLTKREYYSLEFAKTLIRSGWDFDHAEDVIQLSIVLADKFTAAHRKTEQ